MSAMQRNKGAAAEREVAELFRLWGWGGAHRRSTGEESQADQGRDLKGTEPYCIQVQNADRTTPELKLQEAEQAATDGQIPVAFIRRTRGSWMVCMRARDWFKLATPEAANDAKIPK